MMKETINLVELTDFKGGTTSPWQKNEPKQNVVI